MPRRESCRRLKRSPTHLEWGFLHSASVNAPDEEQQLTDPSLEAEFDAWEAASDEDLRRFEESLE